jgi:hypothetical protein
MTKKATSIQSKSKGAGQKVGNPPRETRFRKGQSGNPKGRPKGSKNLRTLIMEAALHPVTATLNGKKRKITNIQATTMQLATKAASGNQAAMVKFLDWIDEIETRAAAAKPSQFPLSEADLEVLRATYQRMKQCEEEPSEDSN